MSFIPTSTSQLLSSLTQLTQASSDTNAASTLTRVAVSQLLTNQVSLATTRQAFTLPSERLTGRLEAGKNYATQLESVGSTNRLNFFPPDTSAPQRLPRSTSESVIAQLPTLLSQQQVEDVLKLQARTIKVSQQQLALQVNGKEVKFDLANANQRFAANQPVQLTLKASPEGWLVSLQPDISSARGAVSPPVSIIRISPAQALTLLGSAPSTTFQISEGQLNLSAKSSANSVAPRTPPNSQLPTTTAPSSYTSSNQSTQTLSTSPSNITVNVNASGLVQLTRSPVLLASLPINDRDIAALTQAGIKQVSASPSNAAGSRGSHDTVSLQSHSDNAQTARTNPTQATIKTVPVTNVDSTNANSTNRIVSLPTNVQQQIVSLIRQSQPLQDSPSQSLTRLINLLDDPALTKDPALLDQVKGIKTQLQSASTNLDNPNIEEGVRQVITGAPLPVTTQQLTAPSTNNPFLSGIISLLQLSLSAKLAQNKPASIERLAQVLAPILSAPFSGLTSPTTTKTSLAKRLSDWLQIEQKHQSLQEITKLLASHQNSKLAGIEQQAQSMETLYYVLPITTGEQRRDAELLIKREPDHTQGEASETQRRAWQLTMKLDIGDKGQILSKAHLKESELELDFYASNQGLVNDVLNFLPYLKTRFESLGILVTKRSCQLGKIPEHLYQRPYHILETRV